jgi:hypothetical protein
MCLLSSFPAEIFNSIQDYLSHYDYRLFLSSSNSLHWQTIKYETVLLHLSSKQLLSFASNPEDHYILRRLLHIRNYQKQLFLCITDLPSIPYVINAMKQIIVSFPLLENVYPSIEEAAEEELSLSFNTVCFQNLRELSFRSLSFPKVLKYGFHQIAVLHLSHISTLSSLSSLTGFHVEELCLLRLVNLTNVDVLSYKNYNEKTGFPKLRKVSMEQCHSIKKFPCMKHICEISVISCGIRNVENLLTGQETLSSKETDNNGSDIFWKLTSLTTNGDSFVCHLSSRRYEYLKFLSLEIMCFPNSFDFSLLTNVDSLRLVSLSLEVDSNLNVECFNCRSLELSGFQFKRNVSFTSKLRKLSILFCVGFKLLCGNDKNEESGWKQTNPVAAESEMSETDPHSYERFELMVPSCLYSFRLEDCYQIDDISMLGKIRHLWLENLPTVKTLAGLGNGNESVCISNLPLVKDLSPLNGLYMVTIRKQNNPIDESTLSRVQHLIIS